MQTSNIAPPGLRAEFERIALYMPDRRVYAIDLSDNTNQWGTPPAAFRAMQSAGKSALTRYPSGYGEELKESLAGYLGVRAEQIATGCGSDDVLDAAIRARSARRHGAGRSASARKRSLYALPSSARSAH